MGSSRTLFRKHHVVCVVSWHVVVFIHTLFRQMDLRVDGIYTVSILISVQQRIK